MRGHFSLDQIKRQLHVDLMSDGDFGDGTVYAKLDSDEQLRYLTPFVDTLKCMFSRPGAFSKGNLTWLPGVNVNRNDIIRRSRTRGGLVLVARPIYFLLALDNSGNVICTQKAPPRGGRRGLWPATITLDPMLPHVVYNFYVGSAACSAKRVDICYHCSLLG